LLRLLYIILGIIGKEDILEDIEKCGYDRLPLTKCFLMVLHYDRLQRFQ